MVNKSSLLSLLCGAPENSKILITTVVDDKIITVPITSAFVIRNRCRLASEVRLQCNKSHDAYAAFVSKVGVEEGTEENFLRRYAGTWQNQETFATWHFDNKYPGFDAEIRPFINIMAYSARIFSTDFIAYTYDCRIFVFKVLE